MTPWKALGPLCKPQLQVKGHSLVGRWLAWEGGGAWGGGVAEEAAETGWSQPISAFITLSQRRCLLNIAVWQHKNTEARSPIKGPTDTRVAFVALVFQGQAPSPFICKSIKLHTFLSVQHSLIPPLFFLLNIVNTTLKCHLYSGQPNAVLKTEIVCNQLGIICIKVGNIEGKRGKTVSKHETCNLP